ncbi:MAG TPA: bifunctional 4-hydroxy-2-oxoglutarate aldolase/2-dehydro-3-deoxy-phosphogluconate aldolase [Puia sp.]
MNKEKVVKAIIAQGFLPLYFHPDENTSLEILKVLYDLGIRVVEYTNRGKQALKNFRSLAKESYIQFPDLILGLGTVLDSKTAAKGIQNGADFLVSPGYTKELFRFSENEHILWIPGCMSPTELIQVQNDGLTLIKIFPASSLGPAFLKSAREIFPDLMLVPTGGIDISDVESWFTAGAAAIGMGSSLISKTSMDKKDFEAIRLKATSLIRQIAAARTSL